MTYIPNAPLGFRYRGDELFMNYSRGAPCHARLNTRNCLYAGNGTLYALGE